MGTPDPRKTQANARAIVQLFFIGVGDMLCWAIWLTIPQLFLLAVGTFLFLWAAYHKTIEEFWSAACGTFLLTLLLVFILRFFSYDRILVVVVANCIVIIAILIEMWFRGKR